MTLNNEEFDFSKASGNWIEAYNTMSYSDIEAIENYSTQFLSETNDPTIDAEDLICTLCVYSFSAVAVSCMVKYTGTNNETGDGQSDEKEEIPVLSVILHPFKESRAISFSEKEKLFGIHASRIDPEKDCQVIEIEEPLKLFAPWKTKTKETDNPMVSDKEAHESVTEDNGVGIITPTFGDFFDETFLNQKDSEPYQVLNNATEIPATDLKAWFDKKGTSEDTLAEPKPIYTPRKVIPLSPAMVKVIWENREHNFSGIINGIRENAWRKMKMFKNNESRKKYLFLVYRTIEALWTHGQQEAIKNPAMAKFTRCDYGKVAEISSFRWAIVKGTGLTEALALHHGNLKIQNQSSHQGSEHHHEATDRNIKSKKEVRFRGCNDVEQKS
jgi:hypothetical protein